MENVLSKESDLLESKELRNKLAERVDVLDKVKELLLIDGTERANTIQVAQFYEVGIEAIKSIVFNNKDELIDDGLENLTGTETREFLGSCNKQLANSRGYFTCDGIKFNNRNNILFPRRAILRIGMLLLKSDVAKRVRTALLDIEEKTSNEVKTQDINEEQKIMLEVGMAVSSGNATAVAIASSKLVAFKNRHIEKLQQDNKALTGEILTWEDRSKINFAVRKFAKIVHTKEGYVWNNLYKELQYKHHINVKLRGDKPWLQHIKEYEWSKVMQSFSALCEKNNISPSDIFSNLEGGQAND